MGVTTSVDSCVDAALRSSARKLEPLERGRIVFIAEKALREKAKVDWQGLLKLTSALALADEPALAQRTFEHVLKKTQNLAGRDSWIVERVQLFKSVLDLYLQKNVEQAQADFRKSLNLKPFDKDTQLITARLHRAAKTALGGAPSDQPKQSPEEKINEHRFRRWQMEQDRDEALALTAILEQRGLASDFIARTSVLAQAYAPDHPQWKGVSNVLSSLSTESELLNRSGALQLLMDHWILVASDHTRTSYSDDDRSLEKATLILGEFAQLMWRLTHSHIEMSQAQGRNPALEELEKRFASFGSPLSLTLSRSLFSRDISFVLEFQKRLRWIDERLRRSQALLGAYYFSDSLNAVEFDQVRTLRGELKELEATRRTLYLEFFAQNAMSEPRTNADYRNLLRFVAQLNRSLETWMKLVPRSADEQQEKRSRELFFSEAKNLLKGIEADANQLMALRKKEASKLSTSITPLHKEVVDIAAKTESFVSDSSTDLKPGIRSLLTQIEKNIVGRIREIDVQINLELSALSDSVSAQKDELNRTKFRLDELRRIRGENLEWRIAQ